MCALCVQVPPADCRVTKGCFGIPDGCGLSSCSLFVSWTPNDTTVHFELSASIGRVRPDVDVAWTAVALSYDTGMVQFGTAVSQYLRTVQQT